MKKFIMTSRFVLVLLLLSATSYTFSSGMPKGKNIQICIELDSTISAHEQWVYLHNYEGNETVIHDSAFIEKGQKEICLYGYTTEEHIFRILFSEKGPIDWNLILAPNSCIKTFISVNDRINPSKIIDGAYTNNEDIRNNENLRTINKKKRKLLAELAIPRLTNEESEKIKEQLTQVESQLDSIKMHIVKHSPSPFNTHAALEYYFKEKVSRDSLITLCNIALKRFPNNEKIESIIRPVPIELMPESEQSKQADKKIKEIITRRIQTELKINKSNETGGSANVDAICLLSDKGEKVAISQLKKKYILIDFWASWCIPCRDGIPYIQQAQERYGDALEVCLISLDKKHESWKKAIEFEKVENCINLIAIDENGNMDKNIEKMNIASIPYNILLDENHHIIATDLHKKDLLNKLDELIK